VANPVPPRSSVDAREAHPSGALSASRAAPNPDPDPSALFGPFAPQLTHPFIYTCTHHIHTQRDFRPTQSKKHAPHRDGGHGPGRAERLRAGRPPPRGRVPQHHHGVQGLLRHRGRVSQGRMDWLAGWLVCWLASLLACLLACFLESSSRHLGSPCL
jgi:hypothetical protein